MKYFGLAFFLASFTILGCHPAPVSVPYEKDQYGCVVPPPDVFTQVGIDFSFAKSTFKDLMLGGIDLKTNPQVITLASKAVTDARIRDFSRCQAIHRDKFTPEQAAYMDMFIGFLTTNPNSTQVIEWQKNYQFPGKPSEPKLLLLSPQNPNEMPAPEQNKDGTFSYRYLFEWTATPSDLWQVTACGEGVSDILIFARDVGHGGHRGSCAFLSVINPTGRYSVEVKTTKITTIALQHSVGDGHDTQAGDMIGGVNFFTRTK